MCAREYVRARARLCLSSKEPAGGINLSSRQYNPSVDEDKTTQALPKANINKILLPLSLKDLISPPARETER